MRFMRLILPKTPLRTVFYSVFIPQIAKLWGSYFKQQWVARARFRDRLLVLGAGAGAVSWRGNRLLGWCTGSWRRCWCWVPAAGAGAVTWLRTWWRQVVMLEPGAGAGAVSWLCTWWRQVAGAGAGCRCWRWVWVPVLLGAGSWCCELAVHVVETGCWCRYWALHARTIHWRCRGSEGRSLNIASHFSLSPPKQNRRLQQWRALLTMKCQQSWAAWIYARNIIRCCRLSVLCLLVLWGIYTLQVLFWPTAVSRVVLFARILLYL